MDKSTLHGVTMTLMPRELVSSSAYHLCATTADFRATGCTTKCETVVAFGRMGSPCRRFLQCETVAVGRRGSPSVKLCAFGCLGSPNAKLLSLLGVFGFRDVTSNSNGSCEDGDVDECAQRTHPTPQSHFQEAERCKPQTVHVI